MSETASCRPYLLRFCQGPLGLELGFGGDPIRPDAVTVDKNPYTQPAFLGDVSSLVWFKDDSFDWVYSSHCLEDFEDTTAVLKEWFRVLKPGGNLVLFLPDQQRYLAHCAKHGSQPNLAHKHAHFSFEYVMQCLGEIQEQIPHKVICYEGITTYNPYSFSVIACKYGKTS